MNYTMYPYEGPEASRFAWPGIIIDVKRDDSALSVDRSFLIKLVSL